jgi:hypothetical protein
MVTVHLGPSWFFGADACLEALAAFIALCVAFASWRVYRMSRQKSCGVFTVSMVLLTFSFLSRAVTDVLIENIFFELPSNLVGYVFYVGYVIHILLSLLAYLILVCVTNKICDRKTVALLLLILVPSLMLSSSYYVSFYGLSTILLGFITFSYFQNYSAVKKACKCPMNNAFFVFLAFLFLTLAQIMFLFEMFFKPLYVAAQITQAFGYLVLLFALIKIVFK